MSTNSKLQKVLDALNGLVEEYEDQSRCIVSNTLVETMPGRGPKILLLIDGFKPYWKLQAQYGAHAFMINPNPHKPKYNGVEAIQQYGAVMLTIKKYFNLQRFKQKHMHTYYSWVLLPEFSQTGKFHMHGMIYFENANDYWIADFYQWCNRYIGFTGGKTVHDFEKAWEYMIKDYHKHGTNDGMYYQTNCDSNKWVDDWKGIE